MRRAVLTVAMAFVVVSIGAALGTTAAHRTAGPGISGLAVALVFIPFAAIVLVRAWNRRTSGEEDSGA